MSVAPAQPPVPLPTPRYALGLPAGSVRGLHTMLVVGIVCALILLPGREGRPTPIRPYLTYLLFLVIGNFFAAHGNSIARAGSGYASPLHLPAGFVRGLCLLALVATVVYKLVVDPDGLAAQFQASVAQLAEQPELPLIILAGFFLGVIFRWVVGGDRTYWGQDLQAWVSLVSALVLAADALIRLVIAPTLLDEFKAPTWEPFVAAVVAFYFGERS